MPRRLCTDKGFPVVIPLAYGRDGDIVYLHGSAASRLFRGARPAGRDLHDGDLRRRPRRGPLHLQHRHQLPLGRDHRQRHRGEGPRREAPRARAHGRPHHPGTQPRTPAPDREGAAQHHAAAPAARPSPRPRCAPACRSTRRRTTTSTSGPGSSPSPRSIEPPVVDPALRLAAECRPTSSATGGPVGAVGGGI